MKPFIQPIASALLILLFTYAAVSKLLQPEVFELQMRRQVFSPAIASVLTFVLPVSELVAAGTLVIPATRQTGLFVSLVLLILFTGYAGLASLHVWKQGPCNCGGILRYLTWRQHLLLNSLVLCLNLCAILFTIKERRAGN
jgi:hypothetical protein